jgi:hypothetical protein
MTDTSVYQQLRGHLAALRLARSRDRPIMPWAAAPLMNASAAGRGRKTLSRWGFSV